MRRDQSGGAVRELGACAQYEGSFPREQTPSRRQQTSASPLAGNEGVKRFVCSAVARRRRHLACLTIRRERVLVAGDDCAARQAALS